MLTALSFALFLFASQSTAAPTDRAPNGGATQASTATEAPEPVVYKVGGEVTAPHVLSQVDPAYTKLAKKRSMEGVTTVQLVVDAYGSPQNVNILHSMAEKADEKDRDAALSLDQAAVAAVSKYHFAPAMMDDRPVPVKVNVEIHFLIKPGEP